MRLRCAHTHEDIRLQALAEYDLTGTQADPAFDHIVELAARLFKVPTAFISLVEHDRQLFYAKVGLSLSETSREVAFCDHAIRQEDALIVLDTTRDPRFRDNPLVTGKPHIRFYAGMPLRTPAGHAIGTLCLVDDNPRSRFTEGERRNLRDLSRLVFDRLELRRLDLARHASQSRFEQVAGTSPDGVVCADHAGRITFWNTACERLFGYSAEEVAGRGIDLIVPEPMRGGHAAGLHRVAAGGRPSLVGKTLELPARHKDGGEVPVELSLSMWREGGQVAFGAIIRDISERRAHQERLAHLARIDPLTELPNRTVLQERLDQLIGAGRAAAVLMVDLDGFKEVNDSLGHTAGDTVLRAVAERLLACVGRSDTVSRFGGDEFAILLPDVGDPCRASVTAQAVVGAFTEPFSHDGQVLRLGASVGVAISPAHGPEAGEVIACADMALYLAKAEGRHCHRLFTPALRQAAQRRRSCQAELHRAIEQRELVLFYQPQVRLSDGVLIGAEALIRWQHPERGLLSPAAFLDVLDTGPYAAEVGDWVLRTACAQAAAWRGRGVPDFRMAVNLCAAQIRRGDLSQRVEAALAACGLPASGLELEITENIILGQDGALVGTLRSLRERGVGIAFDDYGTGYASLSMLKRFPLTRLKIDRSFVHGLSDNLQDAAIVRAVLNLSRSFDLAVTAEGVETSEQRRRLLAKGCEEAQGYLFGRPVPASDFAAQLGLGGTERVVLAPTAA